jgi:acetyl-CoA carboxylase biotin carboxyl carrier protein
MNEPILLVSIRPCSENGVEVLCPGVGWWSRHPHRGALLGPGSPVGILECQNRRFRLIMPDGAGGRLTGDVSSDRKVAVEHGQVLFRLTPVNAGEQIVMESDAASLGHPSGENLPEGARAVVAPTDGVFYSRPSPEARPFVEVGQRIRTGQPVGLVEVMKTFNQIAYGGPGFPEEAEVLEVRVTDATEIRAGAVLVVVR